jgi:hypothetical protein
MRKALLAMAFALAGVASTVVATTPAQASTSCYYFESSDVGVTVKGHKCVTGSRLDEVWGYVEDTKADGKCAYYQVGWYDANWNNLYYDTAHACPKGTRTNFDWVNRLGAPHWGEGVFTY